MSSFGKESEVPKSNCAGEAHVVREGVFLQPRSTYGSTRVQLVEVERMARDVLSVR